MRDPFNPNRAMPFLARLVLHVLSGGDKEEFVDQELRMMRCTLCREGYMPEQAGDGTWVHNILGVVIPCDAYDDSPDLD